MEYKDIKTADELESWYAEKEDILEGHVRDYAVPFGNVYHLDSPGYVSEERWCDTLPSDRERSTSMALQNGVSTKEIIEHKDEFGWIDRMAISSVADDYAECYMTQAGPDYLDEQEIMNVREQYPELIDSNGEIVWNDPDFMKRGVTFDVENFGEKYKLELVCDSYLDNGSLYVGAYDVTPESDNFGERWADISVNLNNPCQNDRTVFLDMNNLYNPAIIEAIYGLGTVEGIVSHSGFCSYPAFTFDADVISQMRNTQEFMDAFGNSNTGHRYQPLSMAAERLGYNWTSAPHDSLSDTLACLAAQKCVDDHNWCVENLELTEDAIMHAKPIENGSEGLPKDCWDLNPGGRPFAVTEPILHRLQSSAKLCARAGTTTQFTRMTVNQWFDKAERSQRSPLGRSVDIGRAASALNSQHEHAEVPQDLTK